MALILENKRIPIRGREIRQFVFYLQKRYAFPHDVHLHVVQFPCVCTEDGSPAFGLFYIEEDDTIRIEIANDMEWYNKVLKKRIGEKFRLTMILQTIAHEVYHYFQYRDEKKVVENWVDHQAEKILIEYLNSESCKSQIRKTPSFVKPTQDEYIYAIDPGEFYREKAGL